MATVSRRNFVISASLAAGAATLPAIAAIKPANPPDLTNWDDVRREFSLSPEYVHAALFYIAAHPQPVRAAIDRLRKKMDSNPFLTVEHGAFGPDDENLQLRACAAIARYIGGRPDEIALTSNTTTGLSLVYHGLPLRAGEEIVTTTHDHYSHHESIRLAAERSGASWKKVALFEGHDASGATREAIVKTLREAISPATRILGITWVHSSSGVKLPLREIAAMVANVNRERSAGERVLVVVDGVHGIGAEDPLVVSTGIDVIASGLHKWVMGPRGTGFIWARPGVWARMRPTIPSFSSEDLYAAWMMGRRADGPAAAGWVTPGGFESYEHFWAIPEAIEFHERIGTARVTRRIHELNGMAIRALEKMPHVALRTPAAETLHSGIVTFEVDGMTPQHIVDTLLRRKVIISTTPYVPTYARISFGIANSAGDVERTVAAIGELRGSAA